MNMFEAKYIKTAADTRKAWGNYQTYFDLLFQDKIVKYGKPVIITEVQYEGKKRMKAADFLRGNPIPDGYSLFKDC